MKLVKLFVGLSAVVCLTAVALVPSTALALPVILPATAVNWTGESPGATQLEQLGNALKVECAKAKATGTRNATTPLGEFHITFESCKDGIVTCTGLGDAAGTILVLGEWHLVFDKLGTSLTEAGGLGVAILFLPKEVHFECAGSLVVVKGMVLCLILKWEPLATTFEFHCKTNGTIGDPEETKYWNDTPSEVAIAELLASTNGGAFVMAALVGLFKITFPEDVLIMG
jgi:hypothetical protein